MQRDLEIFFYNLYFKKVYFKWDFLRNGSAQTGVALPKYYLFVNIFPGKRKLADGAVRVAAVGKNEFIVTHLVEIDNIKNNKKDIHSIFPEAGCIKIKSKSEY